MTAPIRLERLRFDRAAAIPLAATSASDPAAFDWERSDDGRVVSRPVAYPRNVAQQDPPTLTLSLRILSPIDKAVHVRGRAVNGTPFETVGPASLDGSAEGAVSVTLTMAVPSLERAGVERLAPVWQWEFSIDQITWTPFETTGHDVFVLLDEPQLPWGRRGQPQRATLWLDVLDLAHRWAAGAGDQDRAVAALVSGLYGLGGRTIVDGRGDGSRITYGEVATFGHDAVFKMSEFIATARLEPGTSNLINCADAAAAVALLAAALGCPIRITRLRSGSRTTAEFSTNPVQLLGQHDVLPTSFKFHEVACTVRDAAGDRAWDGCLKLDLDESPEREPFDLGLPSGISFHTAAPGLSYIERLVPPRRPVPVIALRATDGLRYPDTLPAGVKPPIDEFMEESRRFFENVLLDAASSVPISADPDRPLREALLARCLSRRVLTVRARGWEYSFLSVRARLPDDDGPICVVSFATCANRPEAEDVFLSFAVAFSAPLHYVKHLADCALASPGEASVLMLRGLTVVLLATESSPAPPARSVALALDAALAPAYSS